MRNHPERIGIAIALIPGLALAMIIGLFSPRPLIDGIADVAEAIGQGVGFAQRDGETRGGGGGVADGGDGLPDPLASDAAPIAGSSAPPAIGGTVGLEIPGGDPTASGAPFGEGPDVAGDPDSPSDAPGATPAPSIAPVGGTTGGGWAPAPVPTTAPTPDLSRVSRST